MFAGEEIFVTAKEMDMANHGNIEQKRSSVLFTESPKLVAFLEDQPFDVFAQHSVGDTEPTDYVCLQTPRINLPCALCEITGDRSRSIFAFNIAVLSGDELGSPITGAALFAEADFVLTLQRATNSNSEIKSIAYDYWSISLRKIQSRSDYIFSHIRSIDLRNQWDLDPGEVNSSLRKLKLFDYTMVDVTPREKLIEVASEFVSKS